MATLGDAKVNIRANLAPLRSGLRAARSAVTNAMRSVARTIKRSMKIAAVAIAAVGVASLKLAMDAEESENLFTVSMGRMAKATREWSDNLADALFLNRFELRKFVSTFNVMLNSMGIGIEEAAEMSQQLTQLALDMASFYNLKPDEAFQKLQAGITGEIEPLKRLGIIVNETTIKQRAMNEGMIVGGQALSEIQKVQLRYTEILSQTTKAQGDMKRTLDSTTNVFRSIGSLIKETGVYIGMVFKPGITGVAKAMRDWTKNSQDEVVAWSVVVKEKLEAAIAYFKQLKDLVENEGWDKAFEKLGVDIKKALTLTMGFIKPYAVEIGTVMGEAFIGAAKVSIKSLFSGQAGVGASISGGALLGGVVGSVAGPLGTAAGAAIGGVIGGAGKTAFDVGASRGEVRQLNREQAQWLRQNSQAGGN